MDPRRISAGGGGANAGNGAPRSASAVACVHHLVEEYRRFLRTSYRFLDPELREQFESHLRQADVVVRGPWITLARDFRRGQALAALVAAGQAEETLLRARWPFGAEPLYLHQERALAAGRVGRPFVVTTATGSGKTEAFLLPVLDGIGGSGLDISYALYTGDSESSARELREEPAEAERLTRADIRHRPPDLLLTNYKQLEFLLVRAEDRPLFTPALRYLVLDELHAYRGALATEIACLIRRLEAHAGMAPGQLVAIGTSATVASAADGAAALAEFATMLFGEGVAPSDVIGEATIPPRRSRTSWVPATPALSPDALRAASTEDEATVIALAERLAGRRAGDTGKAAQRIAPLLALPERRGRSAGRHRRLLQRPAHGLPPPPRPSASCRSRRRGRGAGRPCRGPGGRAGATAATDRGARAGERRAAEAGRRVHGVWPRPRPGRGLPGLLTSDRRAPPP